MVKLLLFRVHKGDPLSTAIVDATRTQYIHAAILKDEDTNLISEAYFPHVRERVLENSELHGIDVFDISTTFPAFTPLTDEQVKGVLAYCNEVETVHAHYSIKGLLDFLPGVQALIGAVRDDGKTAAVFCSQYAFDVFSRGGKINLMNAPSGDMAPGYLPWSLLIKPSTPLTIIANQPTIVPKASFASEVVKAAQEVAGAVEALGASQTTTTTTTVTTP